MKFYSPLLFFFLISNLFTQTFTNVPNLMSLADDFESDYQKNRVEVEEYARINNVPVRQELPDGTIIEMQYLEDGRPIYYMTNNLGAAQTTRTNELWHGGSLGLSVTGSGYSKLGQWDGGGVLLTHQEFDSRVTMGDATSGTDGHATHVAGTMVAEGVDPSAKGMAYQANLSAYDWNNDGAEMATAAVAGMELSNHSYGYKLGWSHNPNEDWYWNGMLWNSTEEDSWFGAYRTETGEWDDIAYNAPYYLIVKSAGNDRGETYTGGHYHWYFVGSIPQWVWATDSHGPDGGSNGYDCIGWLSIGKNILTVGAVNELINYTAPSDVIISSFSGWGPADDGRIKPDIVGKGVSVYSTDDDNDSDYATKNGTSMASPNVTGTLALLQQHYQNTHSSERMYSSTLKGLAIHTADEAGSASGPDYIYGWGLMNAERAAELISLDSGVNNVIDEQVLSNGNTYTRTIQSDGINPLRVTICWTDPRGWGVPGGILNDRTPMLINDLDLKLTQNATTYYPWKLDPDNPSNAATNSAENNVDNIEQVYISSPSAGTYTIEVSHDGTLSGGSQAFSIIVNGIPILPPNKAVSPSPGNGAINQLQTVDLSWQDGGGAKSYDVYFWEEGASPQNIGNQTDLTYDPGQLVYGEHYYWRIDAVNSVGTTQGNIWDFTILSPATYVSPPYSTGFESGILDEYWSTQSSNSYGRIQVTNSNSPHTGNYHLTMDVNTSNNFCTNEAWLHVDLSGINNVDFEFWWKEFSDETHSEDGIYFSDDGGASFTKVLDLNGTVNEIWIKFNLDVDQLASTNGLSLNSTFVIKFQQYDNYKLTSDGFAFDDISITGIRPCINGSIIYNTATGKFNFCEDGVWVEK